MSEIEDNFRKWWHDEGGSVKYAEMIDSGASMLTIIEMIFDAGQMAALNDAEKVMVG